MANGKPVCGSQGQPTDSVGTVILAIWAGVGTLGSIIGLIVKANAVTTLPVLGISGAGIGLMALSAAAAALAMLITVFSFYWDRCLSSPDGLKACSAGVINEIVRSFNSASDEIFPFSAMHDRVDVVVKHDYWPLVQTNAQTVKCAGDPDQSPILQGLYKNSEVCAAGLGATIGAGAGAIGGVIVGILAAAAIGCATIILCIIALIVAAIVAAAIVLAGALAGGQIGKAIAHDGKPKATDGTTLRVGDYVTTKGDLITSGDFDGARVYWFVNDTTQHGRSTAAPEFSFADPDANLTVDACGGPIIL